MHTPVFFIPEIAPIAQVIAMPLHHRKRKHARAELGAPSVVSVLPCRDGSYKNAKEAVIRLCKRRHLEQWQINICVGLYAREVSAGRSKANAISVIRKYADRFARSPDYSGGDAA